MTVLLKQAFEKMSKGKWIALKNSALVGSHESRVELYQSLKKEGKLAGTMFFRMD
jgi:hypothetical protein